MKKLCLFILLLLLNISLQAQEAADSAIFAAFQKYAFKEKIAKKETGERVAAIAMFFLETPYVGWTLEADGPERLQVNLRALDCTTFVENVLALHNVLKVSNPDFNTYTATLTKIRYRNGIIDGYPSRLHYTTDWLMNNESKGLLRFVKMGKVSEHFPLNLNFMSTHPNVYSAFKNNPEYIAEMANHEKRLNGLSLKYLPKAKLTDQACFIHTGDIIAIGSAVSGLDFAHLGIALRRDGVVYLIHASSSGKKVIISSQSLKDYLSGIKNHTGIVVVRPL